MPDQTGRLNNHERLFAKAFAKTGDRQYAAKAAGYKHGHVAASKTLSRPGVQAEIARIQQELLFSDILPLAVSVHKQILADERTPAGARVQAVKLAYDRTLGSQDGGNAKEPHEMTPDEIAEAIAKLEAAASAKAKPIEQPKADVFE